MHYNRLKEWIIELEMEIIVNDKLIDKEFNT